ncbi:MAG: phosphoglycerate dehydrogenase [Candidatus Zipacnadales bacterium]
MKNARVLILARAFRREMPQAAELLLAAGCELIESPQWRLLEADELAQVIPGIDACIAGNDRFTREVFLRADRLKVISRWGIGVDAIDLQAATEHGVVVTNTPGLTAEAVADFTFMLLLALARRLQRCEQVMGAGEWDEVCGVDLWRKTLGIIGFGASGRAVARRARGFEMRIFAYDVIPDANAAQQLGVTLTDLPTLLRVSDFVSLHASADESNDNMISEAELALMKPSAYLVNTARGRLVDEWALAEALRTGRLAGAAIDVHRTEPPGPEYCLRKAPNCILTPHSAFNSVETVQAVNRLAVENLLAVLRGERPEHVVNPAVYGT